MAELHMLREHPPKLPAVGPDRPCTLGVCHDTSVCVSSPPPGLAAGGKGGGWSDAIAEAGRGAARVRVSGNRAAGLPRDERRRPLASGGSHANGARGRSIYGKKLG